MSSAFSLSSELVFSPSLAPCQPSSGYTVANFIVVEITDYPHETSEGKARDKLYDHILANLQGLEERLVRQQGANALGLKIPVTKDDVGYLVEEVYRGRSVVSKLPTRLTLIRWEKPVKGFRIEENWDGQKHVRLELHNLVLMTREEAAVHEKEILKEGKSVEDIYGEDVITLVERRREEEKVYERYR